MQSDDVGQFYESEAWRLAGEGKLLQAAACYKRAADLASETILAVPLLFQLADLYDAMGYVDRQISILEQIISEHPQNLKALALAKERLANVLVDGLGNRQDAMRLYRSAEELSPSASALLRQGCLAASAEDFDEAARCHVQALQLDGRIAESVLYLQVGAAVFGRSVGEHVNMYADQQAAVAATRKLPDFIQTSWDYVCSSTSLPPHSPWLFAYTYDMLHLAMDAATIDDGLVLECGVFHGKSIRMIASHWPDSVVHGFDTFEGIPEQWGAEPAGSYSTHGLLPPAPDNVIYHAGLFSETLPLFLDAQQGPVRFLNIDCDLYSSTVQIFNALHQRIVPGTIIVFDEYVMHANWKLDEFLAFQEAVSKYGWRYEYLGISLVSKQAVVRIIE